MSDLRYVRFPGWSAWRRALCILVIFSLASGSLFYLGLRIEELETENMELKKQVEHCKCSASQRR